MYYDRNWVKLQLKVIFMDGKQCEVFKRPDSLPQFPNAKITPLLLKPSYL